MDFDLNFTPLDELTAAEMNTIMANLNGLKDGSAVDNGAITPAKRSGGYKVGTMTPSVSATFTVTGVGFTPKSVRFTHLRDSTTVVASFATGGSDGTVQWSTYHASASGSMRSSSNTIRCLFLNNTSGTTLQEASFVEFNSDGFVLNVITASGAYGGDWIYEAFA